MDAHILLVLVLGISKVRLMAPLSTPSVAGDIFFPPLTSLGD